MPGKIVVTRSLGSAANAVVAEALGADTEVVAWPHDSACSREWLLEHCVGAVGLAVMLSDKIDEELLDRAGADLKVVSTMSVGYDHISLAAVRARGIKLGYTPDVLTDAVADLTCTLTLMAMRRVKESVSLVESGKWGSLGWGPFLLCGSQIGGKTIGFLGMGRISEATALRLAPFGAAKIIYSNSGRDRSDADAELSSRLRLPVEKVPIEALAAKSDVVIVLCSGGSATLNLVSDDFLGRMEKTAVLVNCARGTVVDNEALYRALDKGQILGAALDVIAGEPHIPADHPLVRHPRCVVLPHIGSATSETREEMAMICAENVARGVRGEPLRIELK